LRQRLLRLRSRPALSTAIATYRAMAMTALIMASATLATQQNDAAFVKVFVLYWMLHFCIEGLVSVGRL
jgi:hypothetical protein